MSDKNAPSQREQAPTDDISQTSEPVSKCPSHSLSMIYAQRRAKAEAARARLHFTEIEAELLKQKAVLAEEEKLASARSVRKQAIIDADLHLIRSKQEAAALSAEADAMESNFETTSEPKIDKHSLKGLGSISSTDRARQYIINQAGTDAAPTSASVKPNTSHTMPSVPNAPSKPADARSFLTPSQTPRPKLPVRDDALNLSPDINQDSNTASANPRDAAQTLNPEATSDLGHYLLKKELLISRMREFNEKPETYAAWKASFCRLVADLKMNSSDELEMLCKWLGPTSRKFAESARNTNMIDPARRVRLLWERLDSCYGTPEEIEASLLRRLHSFEPILHNNPKRYYDFVDLLSEVESLQHNERYRAQLAVFSTSSGVTPIARKVLPHNIYEKWVTFASRYKVEHNMTFPPFTVFLQFIKDQCRIRNDPSFTTRTPISSATAGSFPKSQQRSLSTRPSVSVRMTTVSPMDNQVNMLDTCPIHLTKHTLNDCRVFRSKPIHFRRKYLSDNGICFGCCISKDHVKQSCSTRKQCNECKKDHPTALHIDFKHKGHGGEQSTDSTNLKAKEQSTDSTEQKAKVNTKCTEVCGTLFSGKSCAKIVLVHVYHKDNPENSVLTYAILDEQSNRTLAKSALFTSLNLNSREIEYTMTSCSGQSNLSGRVAEGCVIESYDGTVKLDLPLLIECDDIPENRDEIPTPDVAASYSHLRDIQSFIPPLHDVPTLLLIGRDLGPAHHVLDQRLNSVYSCDRLPYAQKLRLGWVIVGESCLREVHQPASICVNKMEILPNGRPTTFDICESKIHVTERDIAPNVFIKTPNDNKVGTSVEDREFLDIMRNDFTRTSSGNWQAPLPFRPNRQMLPNNRDYTLRRAMNLRNNLMRDSVKCEHMVEFIGKMIERNHAEISPPLKEGEESWYLPVFGIYHPQKPGQIRAVFDSSAQYRGISLNSVLLRGPDLNNSLLDVLLRFRREAIAAIGDIEQMFHSFLVKEEFRNYLCFFWFEDNDPKKPLIEYRMRVHLFGNSPSPAVACYGLRKTADSCESKYGRDVRSFIYDNFYVDDALISQPTSKEVIDLLTKTRSALKEEGNLRLHKFASNSLEVMQAFQSEDLAKDLKDLDLDNDTLPSQRSLGLIWNLDSDNFSFRMSNTNKPYTRRGILAIVNSIYDPLGFAAPVVIGGKLLLRKLMSDNSNDWDDPLDPEFEHHWELWKTSLQHLERVSVPRCYASLNVPFCDCSSKELLIYSDASEDAIAAVAYIRIYSHDHTPTTSFVMGKAKVAPCHGHSMPRLELCAAVLAVEIHDIVLNALQTKFDKVVFHTDSRVVLGYINNRTRRFFMYVSNRVERIRQSSEPDQWLYISSQLNPADSATRPTPASELQTSPWLSGDIPSHECVSDSFSLVEPDKDCEIKPQVSALKTDISKQFRPMADRFSRFSSWKSLLRAISLLRHVTHAFSDRKEKCTGWHICPANKGPENIEDAKLFILRIVQRNAFQDDIALLENGHPVSRSSPLRDLDPYLDKDNLLCVGGRLANALMTNSEKFPVILPKNAHVSLLILRHYHQKVIHQGRQITHGALRSAGYWIIGEKKLISSLIHHCVTCRKARGKIASQKMSNLPDDRLMPAPPFTFVGIDVFGPWNIVHRRTRGALVNSKRWAVLFTCLSVRANHIEIIEEMTSSCFINALRRFISIRGPVKEIRSDRSSNFVGSIDDLNVNVINVEDDTTSHFLNDNQITWKFNPPHSSHMGGVWERMIGVSRRILDSLLATVSEKHLTHEMLVTFMCEVMAIVNARPLVPVTTDPSNPHVLSPSVILTQKLTSDIRPFKDIDQRDMYKAQWKRVQCLAENFWKRWSTEFLQSLQKRVKWQDVQPNVKDGDIVLMKQTELHRNDWPLAIITKVLPSSDGLVRKAEIRIVRDGVTKTYTRPISELVLLLSE